MVAIEMATTTCGDDGHTTKLGVRIRSTTSSGRSANVAARRSSRAAAHARRGVPGGGRRARATPPRASTRTSTNAVHEYRKALRRARAVLALVAARCRGASARAVRKALQEARACARQRARSRGRAGDARRAAARRRGARDRRRVLDTAAEAMPPRRRDQAARSPRAPPAPPPRPRRSRPRCPQALDVVDDRRTGVARTYDEARAARKRGEAHQAVVPRAGAAAARSWATSSTCSPATPARASPRSRSEIEGVDRYAGPGRRPDHAARLRRTHARASRGEAARRSSSSRSTRSSTI